MSVTLERQTDGRIIVRDPIRREIADLLAQVPQALRPAVQRLIQLERQRASLRSEQAITGR